MAALGNWHPVQGSTHQLDMPSEARLRILGWSGCPPDLENQRSKGERIHPDRRGLVSSWRVGNWGERRNSYCGDQVCDGEDSEIRDDSDSILLSEGALTGSRVLLTVFS